MNAPTVTSGTSRLRSILVLLDDGAPCATRVQVAARLAAAHGCELEGLAPTGALQLPAGMNSAALALEAADAARQLALASAQERIEQFRILAAAAGARALSDQAVEGDPASVLVHRTACHDLLVISQPAPGAAPRGGAMPFIERVLLNSPRPTLLVPGQGTFTSVGRHIVVAWDDGPACIRAATEALPLLQQADRVHLCTWHRADHSVVAGIGTRLDDVARWFGRHGVDAVPHVASAGTSMGSAMLDGAMALGADMIVMGTYGHARWLERITGGVTRTALADARIPLFMSH